MKCGCLPLAGAEALDDMTFEMWIYNETKNDLARLMMVLAGR